MGMLKAEWTVLAGLYPGHVIPEYTKKWFYTDENFQQDRDVPPEQMTRFATIVDEANDYAKGLQNPALVNYVRVEFVWY